MRFKKLTSLVIASAALSLFALSGCASSSADEDTSANDASMAEGSSTTDYVAMNEEHSVADESMATTPARTVQPAARVEEIVVGPESKGDDSLVASFVKRARDNYESGNYARALKDIEFALELDPTASKAKALKGEIFAVLGRGGDTIRDSASEGDTSRSEAKFEIERRMLEARKAMDTEDYTNAIELARSALELIRWSQARGDNYRSLAEARELIKIAGERRERQRIDEEVRLQEEQRRTQELLAQSKLQSYQNEIRNLYSEAKASFDRREYGEAVNKLNQILRKDPFNADVMELRKISIDLARGARTEAAERDFSRAWQNAIALLEDANVFPNQHLKWPTHELWERVERRWRRLRAEQEQDISKEDAAVEAALESATVKFSFGSEDSTVTLADVIKQFRSEVANVNFHVKGTVGETELKGEDLGDVRLRSALEHIVRMTGGEVHWRVENGTIYLTGSDEKARSVSQIYDIADILINLKDFRGVEPRLSADDEGQSRFNENDEEEEKEELDGEAILTLLQEVFEGSFDEGREPEVRGTQLAIYAPRETIDKVTDLLQNLRSSQGLVVNVEARFITIRDDFLEDIGLDFRGVGGSPSGTTPQPVSAVLDDVAFGTTSVPVGAGTGNDAGFFFQDISQGTKVDEDIRGRVENLFDQSVGGRRGGSGLTNEGGASFQLSFVDNPEITAILRAVTKSERAVLLTAPAISVHNTQRGHVSILNELKYIRDFNVNVSASTAIADPIVDVIRDGIVLDVRPTVSADRRYVTLELRPTLATLVRPIATISTSLGTGPPVSIQTPELQLQRLRTTVTVPDGGSFLIGGLRRVIETDLESGVPLLSDLPIIGWLFTRKAKTTERQDIIIIVSVSIVDLEEQSTVEGY